MRLGDPLVMVLSVGCLPLGPWGCGGSKVPQGQAPEARVVGRVGGSEITAADVQAQVGRLPMMGGARPGGAAPDAERTAMDEIVRFGLMVEGARRRGYDRDPQIVRTMKHQMVAKLLREEIDAKVSPDRVPVADVERYFREHQNEFQHEAQVRVSQIFVRDEAKAKKIAAEVKAARRRGNVTADLGAFRDLVVRHSEDDVSRLRNGDLAYLKRSSTDQPAAVVSAAFALAEVGDVSEPVKSDKGYHILKLTQTLPAVVRTLEDVKKIIQQRLVSDLRKKRTDELLAELRRDIKVELDEKAVREALGRPPAAAGPAAALPQGR